MLLFSLAAALFAAAAVGFVLWRAARAPVAPSEAAEEAVYARQIAELDEQKAQGLMDEDGWRAARAEAGRRLLGAAARSSQGPNDQGSKRDRGITAAAAVGAVALAGTIYLCIGQPGRPDEPFAARLAQWRKAPETLDPQRMVVVLEAERKTRPDDPRLLGFLARAHASAGQYVQAAGAFETLTKVRPGDARVWADLGEMRMAQNDGRVGPDARAAFEQALKVDPHQPIALGWLGRDAVLAGRREEGLARWRTLLASLPAGDPRRAEFARTIEAVESGRFGQAQTVAAAPPQAQAAMIRGMVEGLARRLERQRGEPSDWAKLVRAYTVLGDTAARDRALARARALFAGRPQDLQLIESAARVVP